MASSAEGPSAAIVSVGNELLYGETVDTNSAWMGQRLAARGVPVVRRYTVGDVPSEIREAVTSAMAHAELVLVTGGLGPTRDDLTKESVAELFGRTLYVDPKLLHELEDRFRSRGYDRLPGPNVRQAEVPEGVVLLSNPRGTAPGLVFDAEACLVVLFPGVPRELEAIFSGDFQGILEDRFSTRLTPVHHRVIHTTGVAESRLSEIVEPLLPTDLGPLDVAFLPDLRGVDLRLSARGVGGAEAESWFDRIEGLIGPAISRWRFEAVSGDLVEAIAVELRRSGRTLAVAESCTGGLIAQRMTERPGASEVFLGGVVAYSNTVKIEQLGVSASDLEREGAVSETVAKQLARGVADRMAADTAISVTGVAGPGGGSPEKPVGTVWYAAAVGGRVEARVTQYTGDRHAIRERAAQDALALLYRVLTSSGPEA